MKSKFDPRGIPSICNICNIWNILEKTSVSFPSSIAIIEFCTLMKTGHIPWSSSIWVQRCAIDVAAPVWFEAPWADHLESFLCVELLGEMTNEDFGMFIRGSEHLTRKLLSPVRVILHLEFTAEFSSSDWAFVSLNHIDSVWLSHFACQP